MISYYQTKAQTPFVRQVLLIRSPVLQIITEPGHAVDLDPCSLRQRCYLHAGSGWACARSKHLCVDPVDGLEIGKISQKHGRPHHVGCSCSSGFEDSAEVLQHLTRLTRHIFIADHFPGLRIQRDLA